ncbi:MAG: AAA family ATPase, partial [Bacteroidales bacterium]
MIKRILLKGIATYQEQVEINNLRKINFFYGSNGSGKTVLSKVIANPDKYSTCEVEWENKLKTVVFNEDFVSSVFYQSDSFPGIYTIGEEAIDIENQIKTKKEEKTQIEDGKKSLDITLRQKNEDLKKINDNLLELCWKKIYQKYQNDFEEIFAGYKNSKQNFSNRLLKEFSENHSQLQTKEYLTQRYELLYKEKLKIINELNLISNDIITQFEKLEFNEILWTKIIGKKDVDIASMIEKLHNHDWVRQGKQYYEQNYNEENKSYICPFCQQATPDDFKKKLEEYFDETYEFQIKKLNTLTEGYKKLQNELIQYFDDLLLTEGNKYFESKKEDIKYQIDLIKKTLEKNVILIEGKKEK